MVNPIRFNDSSILQAQKLAARRTVSDGLIQEPGRAERVHGEFFGVVTGSRWEPSASGSHQLVGAIS